MKLKHQFSSHRQAFPPETLWQQMEPGPRAHRHADPAPTWRVRLRSHRVHMREAGLQMQHLDLRAAGSPPGFPWGRGLCAHCP